MVYYAVCFTVLHWRCPKPNDSTSGDQERNLIQRRLLNSNYQIKYVDLEFKPVARILFTTDLHLDNVPLFDFTI